MTSTEVAVVTETNKVKAYFRTIKKQEIMIKYEEELAALDANFFLP